LEIKVLEGHEIVLGMDANDSYNPDTTGTSTPLDYNPAHPTVSPSHNGKLCTLVASCGLKDPLALQHSSRPFPASHIRGSKRIDFIFVTPRLQPAVLNSGSLAFHSLFHSDHRAYYVDFDALLMFVDPAHDIAPPSYRRLQLSDPRLRNQYRDILHEQLNYHKIYDKVQAMQVTSDSGAWTSATTEEYQKIDKLVTESMLYAERNTGKRVSTRYEWSPTLKKSVQEFRYWQMRFRQAKGLGISLPRLEVLKQQSGLSDEDTHATTIQDILQRLQHAVNTLRNHQKQQSALRATYLESLAEAIVLDQSPNLAHDSVAAIKEERVASQVTKLIKRENLRRMFRKLQRVLKPDIKQGLSRIDIPDRTACTEAHGNPDHPKEWKGPWMTITKPNEIANVIKDLNRQQYHQAHATPFGSGPVAEAFGRQGNTPAASSVLSGTIPSTLHQAPLMKET
jgi:hypothetical protein